MSTKAVRLGRSRSSSSKEPGSGGSRRADRNNRDSGSGPNRHRAAPGKIFGIDQGHQQFVRALHEQLAIQGRTGQVGDVVEHLLDGLGPLQLQALQHEAESQGQGGEIGTAIGTGEQPAQRGRATAGGIAAERGLGGQQRQFLVVEQFRPATGVISGGHARPVATALVPGQSAPAADARSCAMISSGSSPGTFGSGQRASGGLTGPTPGSCSSAPFMLTPSHAFAGS